MKIIVHIPLTERHYPADDLAHDVLLVDKSDNSHAAVRRVVSVVAHNKEHTLGHGCGKFYIAAGICRLERIFFVERLAVDIDYTLFAVYIHRLTADRYNALYQRLMHGVGLGDDNYIAVIK